MMKRLLLFAVVVCTATMAVAQTMNIKTGSVTTAVSAAKAGQMTYSDGGQTLTIGNKAFAISDIDKIFVDNSIVVDHTVSISYSGSSAAVVVAADIADSLSITVNGAHVTIMQDANVGQEITYTLSGTSANGSFVMDGEFKASVVLNGVNLTSTIGAPIDIENGKRINITVADGTTNTFADGATGTQKSCFFVNGHAEFFGAGTINITGNARHGYRSDEYTILKKSFTGTINIVKAASDGIHVGQYLEMNGGNVVIANVGADGIDVEVTNDPTDEYNGQVFINGGTINATTTADDVKALKSDATIIITGGQLKLVSSGAGSKAIGTKGTLNVSGGSIEAISLGDIYDDGGDNEAKPNAVKSTGSLTISGGKFIALSSNKAFNTDNLFYINGGTVMGIGTKASAENVGTQKATTYNKQQIRAGQTVNYNGVSYTVPSNYSWSSASVMVSKN